VAARGTVAGTSYGGSDERILVWVIDGKLVSKSVFDSVHVTHVHRSTPFPTIGASAVDEFLGVLASMKEAELKNFVDRSTPAELDVLLKFVYKGFETGQNSTILLKWHKAIVDKAGLGSITRVLCDKPQPEPVA